MKFYVVFGILATLALQAIAEETKEAATTAATDRVSSVTKTNFLNDGNKYHNFYFQSSVYFRLGLL